MGKYLAEAETHFFSFQHFANAESVGKYTQSVSLRTDSNQLRFP